MKTNRTTTSLHRALALAAAVLSLAVLGASHARAQAMLTFSGGNGAPLVLKLNAPVTYAVTTAPASGSTAPFFDIQGIGNLFGNSGNGYNVSGTLTFTINSGAAQTLSYLNSGIANGSEATNDAYLVGPQPGVAVGNVVTLSAGMLTTAGNFAGAPPAGGSFQTFLFDGFGNKLDAVNGVAVPEPSTWALLGMGAVGAGVVALRRRRTLA